MSGTLPVAMRAQVESLASQALTRFRAASCGDVGAGPGCPGDEHASRLALLLDDAGGLSVSVDFTSSSWSDTRSHSYDAPAGVVTAHADLVTTRVLPALCSRGGLCPGDGGVP